MAVSPKLSVIIPVYNASRFIEGCIRSIQTQSFTDWEMIIVDDGSTDETFAICQRLIKSDSRIKYITQKNQGVSIARNVGIVQSKGRYIMFVDSDDEILTDVFSTFNMASIANNNPDIIRGEYMACDINGNKLFTSKHVISTKGKVVSLDSMHFFIKCVKYDFFLWLFWIKRECIGDLRFKEGRSYMEDAEFMLGLLPKIKTCCYTSSPIYLYRKYMNGASAKMTDSKVAGVSDIVAQTLNNISVYSRIGFESYILSLVSMWLDAILCYIAFEPYEKRDCLLESTKIISCVGTYVGLFPQKDPYFAKILTDSCGEFFEEIKRRHKRKLLLSLIKSKLKKIVYAIFK